MISNLKRKFLLNAKNIAGWRTGRKIVVISVDDYGNVRLDSKEARETMNRAGLKIHSRFDAYDTMETKDDLEALFEVLASVKDKNGRPAVFTTFAMPCNINFEKMAEDDYSEYHYELLPETFDKLSGQQPGAYSGAWELLKDGITNGFMMPQFHGREHLNLNVFEEKLKKRDSEVLTALKNRSYTSISNSGFPNTSVTAAFDFEERSENKKYEEIIFDGLNAFEKVYGYRASHFTPPVYSIHQDLFPVLKENGIHYIDTALIKNEHQGNGKYRKRFNYTGKRNKSGQIFIVRNVVFEPTEDRGVDWVSYTMKQIEAAFRWNRPAIISSHRVNFCGHIDEKNRKRGLEELQKLLQNIVQKWPDVEFMAANELGDLVSSNIKKR